MNKYEPFGTVERYLGDGTFVITTKRGEVIARLLPTPDVADSSGRVFTKESIDDAALKLIGKPVGFESAYREEEVRAWGKALQKPSK